MLQDENYLQTVEELLTQDKTALCKQGELYHKNNPNTPSSRLIGALTARLADVTVDVINSVMRTDNANLNKRGK